VVHESPGHRIGRIDSSGKIAEFSAGLSAGSSAQEITAGPDGALWFTEDVQLNNGNSGGKIGRITTSGTIVESSDGISDGSSPDGIALGPAGNLWFTEYNGNRIGKLEKN